MEKLPHHRFSHRSPLAPALVTLRAALAVEKIAVESQRFTTVQFTPAAAGALSFLRERNIYNSPQRGPIIIYQYIILNPYLRPQEIAYSRLDYQYILLNTLDKK